MKKLKHLFFILFTCAVQNITAQTDAEYKYVKHEYRISESGTIVEHHRKELTIFTHMAMNKAYGETFIEYDPTYQSIHINESYTQRPDGSIVQTPQNAFVDVLPSTASAAPDFNKLREKVVVHTALELGATIVLDYTITTKPGFGIFALNQRLQEDSPIKKLYISVEGVNQDDYSIELYGTIDRMLTWQGNKYTATLYDLSALSHEKFLPSGGRNEVRLLCAPKDKGYISALFSKESVPELKQIADSLLRNTTDSSLTARSNSLIQYVRTRFAHTPLTFHNTGERLRPLLSIIRSGYATQAERNTLLAMLLRSIGIQADVVGVWPSFNSEALCSTRNVKSWLTRIVQPTGTTFWNAETGTKVNPNLTADSERLLTTQGEEIPTQGEPLLVRYSDTLRLQKEGADKSGYLICTLPSHTEGADGWGIGMLPNFRESDLELPSMLDEEGTFFLKPEAGLSLVGTPKEIKMVKPCGEMSQTSELLPNGTWRITRRLKIYETHYYATQYHALRELLTEWVTPSFKTLLFKTH